MNIYICKQKGCACVFALRSGYCAYTVCVNREVME